MFEAQELVCVLSVVLYKDAKMLAPGAISALFYCLGELKIKPSMQLVIQVSLRARGLFNKSCAIPLFLYYFSLLSSIPLKRATAAESEMGYFNFCLPNLTSKADNNLTQLSMHSNSFVDSCVSIRHIRIASIPILNMRVCVST